MQKVRQANALMVKIAHQLRPPATITMAPYARCGKRSPAGNPARNACRMTW